MNLFEATRICASLIVLLFGIVVGSFLNVCIYRLPRDMSVADGFSKCPTCESRLRFWDLIPLFSYLGLRGKCRYCKAGISPQYPLVELANGLLWLGVYLRFGMTLEALAYVVIVSSLLVIFLTDLLHMIIPDSMNVAMGLAGLLLLFQSTPEMRVERLIGMVCVSGVFLLIALVSGGRAMGGGDIKMMAALGLCLGWKLILFTTLFGAVLGSVVYLISQRTKTQLGRVVPFGAFLAIAGILALFCGNELIHWYLGFFITGHTHGANGEILTTHLD